MKSQTGKYKPSRQVITLLSLLVLIVLLVLFRQSPERVERYYYQGFYQFISHILHPVLNAVPFSIGDIIYALVILSLLFGLFRLVRFLFIRQPKKAGVLLLRFFICLEIAWLWFYCFWGLNYYRPPAAHLLGYNDTTYTIKDVATVTNLIIDSANSLRPCIDTVSADPVNKTTYQYSISAVASLKTLSAKFTAIKPRAKASMYGGVLNYLGTSGYFNPFTGEAQINAQMPFFDKPFVSCHEMGHQTGWAREDEANFAGYLAGTNSGSALLRYSAYYAGIEEFMRYLRRRDTTAYRTLRKKISPLVFSDFKADSAYWTKYQGGAEMVSGMMFDKFLKANNQPHGLRTYNRMIILTMGYYRKRYKVW